MPSNKRQKELARRRAERQAARRAAERSRRRKRRAVMALAAAGVIAVVALAVVVASAVKDDDKDPAASPTESATPPAEPEAFKSFPVACGGERPEDPEAQKFDKAPPMSIDKDKKYTLTMKTSCGDIVVALDAKNAPNTTNSFHFLAGKKFYDGSICHRMNDADTFAFLQCGDPTGTGSGDAPGYTLAEENTKDAKYTRGTLAMANTGQPNSTGAQFFLVAKDSQLPPSYTVAGHITKGLDVLDKIIALGTDGAFEPSPGGGHPKQAVYLEQVTVKES